MTDAYGQPTRTAWVVNSGTAHSDQIPTSHIAGWVRDALDSIDFIRGDPTTSPWARRRAEMGRTKPFTSLKYLAVGNEGPFTASSSPPLHFMPVLCSPARRVL
jgi:alpha-L-arabinofuranosidase